MPVATSETEKRAVSVLWPRAHYPFSILHKCEKHAGGATAEARHLQVDFKIFRLIEAGSKHNTLLYPAADRLDETYDTATCIASATNRKTSGI